MVRKCETHIECLAFESASRARSQLIEFCGTLSNLYRIRKDLLVASVPSLCSCPSSTIHAIKKFCGGLIEGGDHPWRGVIRGLGRRQRLSISASLFLFRKVLPSPLNDLHDYLDTMSSPSPSPSPEFIRFCERRVGMMFPYGWDRNYSRVVDRVGLPVSSSVEMGKSEGGVREFVASGKCWFNHDTYLEVCKTAKAGSLKLGPSKVVNVETGGKNRIVSVPCADMNFLRPLHTIFYDRLSRFPWLLRGDAVPSRFEDFVASRNEVFVSGDYESATDNLNSHVQKFLLRKVLENSASVPVGIKELAEQSLRMELYCESSRSTGCSDFTQQRGQLMGNLLSFPLLCLVNFLAFKFVVPRKVPLKVNGDDIVFRASPREAELWKRRVGESGLTLSPGKTMTSNRFFSLNSCFFDARSTYVKNVPLIRPKSLFGCVDEGVMSCRDRFRSFMVGFDRPRKEILHESFLRANRRFVLASHRSVRNGLQMKVSDECLEKVGLLNRERCYLDQFGSWVKEVALSDVAKEASPYKIEGWVLERRELDDKVKDYQKEHTKLVHSAVWTWSVPRTREEDPLKEKKRLIKESGWNVSNAGISVDRIKRFVRLSGCSRREANRLLNKRVSFPPVNRDPKGDRWWIPTCDASKRCIVFLSSGLIPGSL
nr:MAG: RNA-dependent RNA polymerase [Botourmiaviridae sp.]